MRDPSKTIPDLIEENSILKQRIQELEQSESDRKQTKEAMRDIETRYRILFAHSPDGIVIIDPATARFLEFNEMAHRQLGYSREEFSGLSISDIDVFETSDETRAHIQKVIREGWSDFETLHRTRQGEIRNIHVTAQYTEISGHPVYHCIWRDITSRKQTEEALQRAHDELEQRVADRTEELIRINEELRTEITERKRAEEEMVILAEIGQVIGSTLDIDEVYEKFAAEARKLIPFDRITVNLCNIRENIVTIAYVSGADFSNYKQGDSLPLTGTFIEEVLRKRTGLIIQSEKMDEIVSRIPAFSRTFQAGLRSLIGIPLIYKGEAIGTLQFRSKTPNAYTDHDLRLAERIGDQIAGAIANAQLFRECKQAEEALQRAHDELEQRVADRTKELLRVNEELRTEITERKRAEEELERHRMHLEEMVKERTAELEIKNITLQELNTTLKVLLKQREDDKEDMEERFVMNVRNLVLPFVEQMKKGRLEVGQQPCLDIIETHLHNIATPLMKNIRQFNLTPKELKVAALVRNGRTTKEIAAILSVATGSIDIHRNNIRKKLGLNSRKTNLQSHLDTLG